jgi:hypothetical protein
MAFVNAVEIPDSWFPDLCERPGVSYLGTPHTVTCVQTHTRKVSIMVVLS